MLKKLLLQIAAVLLLAASGDAVADCQKDMWMQLYSSMRPGADISRTVHAVAHSSSISVQENTCTSTANDMMDYISRHTLRLSPMLCKSCHRRKSILPGWVAYLKRPPTFIVSWLPLRMCSAPPAAAASFCSLSRKYSIWTSLSPLSNWSPTCSEHAVQLDASVSLQQSIMQLQALGHDGEHNMLAQLHYQ